MFDCVFFCLFFKGFFHRSSNGKEELECETGGTCTVLYTIPKIAKNVDMLNALQWVWLNKVSFFKF